MVTQTDSVKREAIRGRIEKVGIIPARSGCRPPEEPRGSG